MYAILSRLEKIEKLLFEERRYRGNDKKIEERYIQIYMNLPDDVQRKIDDIILENIQDEKTRKIQREFRRKLRERIPSTMHTIQTTFTSRAWTIKIEKLRTIKPTVPLSKNNFKLFFGIEFEAQVENMDDEYRTVLEDGQWLIGDNNRMTLRLQTVVIDENGEMLYTFDAKQVDNQFREIFVDVVPDSLLITSMSSDDWNTDNVRLDITQHL